MFSHILKAVKGIFSRREQAKQEKGQLSAFAKKDIPLKKKVQILKNRASRRKEPQQFKTKQNPFKITHGRKEAGCRWWPEIGKGFVIKIRKTKNNDFKYLVMFSFLGAHRVKRAVGSGHRYAGLKGGAIWLPASELV